jgi:hypothetical protein
MRIGPGCRHPPVATEPFRLWPCDVHAPLNSLTASRCMACTGCTGLVAHSLDRALPTRFMPAEQNAPRERRTNCVDGGRDWTSESSGGLRPCAPRASKTETEWSWQCPQPPCPVVRTVLHFACRHAQRCCQVLSFRSSSCRSPRGGVGLEGACNEFIVGELMYAVQ